MCSCSSTNSTQTRFKNCAKVPQIAILGLEKCHFDAKVKQMTCLCLLSHVSGWISPSTPPPVSQLLPPVLRMTVLAFLLQLEECLAFESLSNFILTMQLVQYTIPFQKILASLISKDYLPSPSPTNIFPSVVSLYRSTRLSVYGSRY